VSYRERKGRGNRDRYCACLSVVKGDGKCLSAWVALGCRVLLFAIMVRDLELSQGNGDGEGGVLMRGEVGVGDFFEDDKENMCVSLEDVVEPLLSHQRSPLPTGYLRSPLQDITAVLSSVNVCFFWLCLAHFRCLCNFIPLNLMRPLL
jgi:hypothetical protein